ncbi:SDR family oxidoreductase [uncultured Alsobacter sp.]|uniref:SDR family oxidoreductase n=1 Tax=uncultured Alsobacter sp. TaxID=1748258 RepID=UPI0025F2CC15|nr:SDR family oxidoreductase [uncultured Alsobacter sp.]
MPVSAQTVIVTGAAGGIGRALVEEFAARGARVIAVDLASARPEDAIAGLGARHRAYGCDLGSEAEIVALFETLDREVGTVDVLMNNAAIGPIMSDTRKTDFAHFQLTVRVNTIGPFVMAREVARRMAPGGVIVNTASLAGVLANPRRNAYAASKAALISLTKSLACEWASRGIRVNAVAPGYVRTPMVAELERTGKADIPLVRRRVPMGRMGRPDEIASAAVFLASPKARYVTGSVLAVDGGWMSFNQPGHAHPAVEGVPADELGRPKASSEPRVVVVVGGGRGIGAAIAARFAAGGDRVVVADKDGAGAVTASLGPQHLGVTVDITDEAQVRDAFTVIRECFGHVDVLVNDAAVADVFKPALEQTGADLAATLDVNLAGTFLCTREALGLMEGRKGVILNLGSINTFLPFAPRHGYGASKAAVDVFTRCLAGELGPQGHRTATIAPGYIRTPGVAELETSGRIDAGKIRRRIPMGDMGRPEDIADAAWFLASPAASYVNGGILYVDGGWTSFGNAGDASTGED